MKTIYTVENELIRILISNLRDGNKQQTQLTCRDFSQYRNRITPFGHLHGELLCAVLFPASFNSARLLFERLQISKQIEILAVILGKPSPLHPSLQVLHNLA